MGECVGGGGRWVGVGQVRRRKGGWEWVREMGGELKVINSV